jgi:hypothetical protein
MKQLPTALHSINFQFLKANYKLVKAILFTAFACFFDSLNKKVDEL